MHVFDADTIRARIGEADALKAVRRAFEALAHGNVQQPSPMSLDFPEVSGEAQVKAAHIKGAQVFAIKVATGFYLNGEQGLPPGSGVILVFDATTGMPLAVLADGGYLTELRTGAAGALAADLLAPDPVKRVAFIGSGVQARYQARAIFAVRPWNNAVVWSPDADAVARYCQEMASELGVPFRPAASAKEAVRGADLIVTVTPSRGPLVRPEWLESHATVIAVGADSPHKQELDVGVLARADKVVADDWSQCLRLGEIHHGVSKGVLNLNDIHAELGKVLVGERSGREADELIVCDLTGVGAQDAAIAELAYEFLTAELD